MWMTLELQGVAVQKRTAHKEETTRMAYDASMHGSNDEVCRSKWLGEGIFEVVLLEKVFVVRCDC